ncbi:thioredoxin family protein [Labilibacter marinus]|uniref:thioredoxin family protein n=1 Tax=Labilibacter marinus TaxID=1477105 RepID=UPI00094FF441|nr:thioredoxin family protein [Labilibacter marinus]
MQEIRSLQEWQQALTVESIVIGYFSHDKCSVCKVLLPKVEQLMSNNYPKAKLLYCNIEQSPELAAQQSVFTAPTIVIFVEEKEYVRFSRNIGLVPLGDSISRPYSMLFSD